jgi:hypothetical protein
MTRLTASLLAALLALGAGSGCASLSEYRARSRSARAGMEGYRYRQPIELVWPEVRRLLADRGLGLAGKDAAAVGQKSGTMSQLSSAAKETRSTSGGGLLMETSWNQDGVRWRAEATPDAGGLRVVLTRIEINRNEFGTDGVTLRDYELELDLLRRVDVEEAERIEEGRPAAAPVAKPVEPPVGPPAASPVGPPG